jgi:hypothetical protein
MAKTKKKAPAEQRGDISMKDFRLTLAGEGLYVNLVLGRDQMLAVLTAIYDLREPALAWKHLHTAIKGDVR